MSLSFAEVTLSVSFKQVLHNNRTGWPPWLLTRCGRTHLFPNKKEKKNHNTWLKSNKEQRRWWTNRRTYVCDAPTGFSDEKCRVGTESELFSPFCHATLSCSLHHYSDMDPWGPAGVIKNLSSLLLERDITFDKAFIPQHCIWIDFLWKHLWQQRGCRSQVNVILAFL